MAKFCVSDIAPIIPGLIRSIKNFQLRIRWIENETQINAVPNPATPRRSPPPLGSR